MITFQKEESPSASGSGAGSVRNENSFQIAGHRILEVSIRRALKLRHYEHGIQAPMPTKILLLGKMQFCITQQISKKNIDWNEQERRINFRRTLFLETCT